MKYLSIVAVFLLVAIPTYSQDPIFSIEIKDTNSFTVEGFNRFSIYGLSDRMKTVVQKGRNRKILAAEHESGLLIRSVDPKIAAQEILSQLSTQTGANLGTFHDTYFAGKLEPDILLMAFDQKSVWNLLLTQKEQDLYLLSITCLIDE